VKTIVAGYDGTRSAERALERASELARAFGASVVVVSVAMPEPIPAIGAFGLLPYDSSTEMGLRTDETLRERHREHVHELFAGAGVPVEFVAATGQPADEIVDLADRHGADLIVVGTREPGFVERLLGGSVSQGVARRAHCDVLIVHPPPESES
jgi:nucleotide-binding universal stress UspA family protein